MNLRNNQSSSPIKTAGKLLNVHANIPSSFFTLGRRFESEDFETLSRSDAGYVLARIVTKTHDIREEKRKKKKTVNVIDRDHIRDLWKQDGGEVTSLPQIQRNISNNLVYRLYYTDRRASNRLVLFPS